MLNSFLLSARCVLPVLMLIASGFGFRRAGWLRTEGVTQMDKVSFHVLLPLLLFQNIYSCDLKTSISAPMLLAAVLLSLCTFGLSILLSSIKKDSPPTRASLAQGMFRNNCVLYGMPIITALYGQEAAGTFSMLLAVIIPLNNILSVLIISLLASRRFRLMHALGKAITNPFVISAALALSVNVSGLSLPHILQKFISDLASCATPIALILLGASLSFGSMRAYRKEIVAGVFTKLFLWPLLFLPLLVATGLRSVPLVSLYLSIGTPCAVSAHIMAKQMGADGDLAGHLVVFGAAGSILSIFMFLFVLSYLQLI